MVLSSVALLALMGSVWLPHRQQQAAETKDWTTMTDPERSLAEEQDEWNLNEHEDDTRSLRRQSYYTPRSRRPQNPWYGSFWPWWGPPSPPRYRYPGRRYPPRRRPDYDEEEDSSYYHYHFQYKPIRPELFVNVTGGVGDRHDRSIDEIRFNKCPPVMEDHWTSAWRYQYSRNYLQGVHSGIFPLLPDHYPPQNNRRTHILKTQTMADAVVTPDDFALLGTSAHDYMYKLREPVHPSSDPSSVFWEELEHVVDVQIARRADKDPYLYSRWPDLWKSYDIAAVAKAVQNEYPASLQQAFLESIFKAGIEMDYDVMPFRSVNDIVGAQFLMSALNTWTIDKVASISFLLKWRFGVARPEEVAWLIATGDFTVADGVPHRLVQKILSMNLKHSADFTAYEDGSPMHPSWPAMHAAGSTCSIWLPILVKLTAEQYCEALRVDFAVAYARTVAGVHYPQDNYAGLNLGHYIIKNNLPSFMEDRYGCDASAIEYKLEYLSFDWYDFDAEACTIEGVPVGDRLAAYYNEARGEGTD